MKRGWGAAMLGALLLGGMAPASGALPQLKHEGQVSYRTGGIGSNESNALKLDEGNHPLILEFIETVQNGKGAYSSGEQVTIKTAKGSTIFTANSDGPFMLVDLPNGRYAVSATDDGQTQTRWVTVGNKSHQHVTFVWTAA